MQNAPLGALCKTFDLYYAIIGLENHFMVFLWVAVLHSFFLFIFLKVMESERMLYLVTEYASGGEIFGKLFDLQL